MTRYLSHLVRSPRWWWERSRPDAVISLMQRKPADRIIAKSEAWFAANDVNYALYSVLGIRCSLFKIVTLRVFLFFFSFHDELLRRPQPIFYIICEVTVVIIGFYNRSCYLLILTTVT